MAAGPFSTGLPWRAVLGGERDEVAFAQAVVDAGERDLAVAEFAALGAEVLGAGVEPVDLRVGGVCDQRDLADVALLGESDPALHGCLAACSRVSVRWSWPREW